MCECVNKYDVCVCVCVCVTLNDCHCACVCVYMCMDTLLQCSTLMCVMAVGCVCSVCAHSFKVIKVSSIAIYIIVVV